LIFANTLEENEMKKIAFAIAALSAIALAAPSIANAETVVIRHGGHHWDHARAEYHHMHRDWHPFHRHDRVVVVRHHRY
jgi:hypothetical protein